ncbi:hypothetical protein K7711_40915 [Nocardia sp. CA2R105]|uniref:hypothetical protein n=1 Tax=Nocardia coffeae TaxID=2873381 RepID=UPI001CA61836|nr:hypothetical protein [Nocardia coffeae]MBY8862890.1 hypothetical protein [Nocardia coffeae]
MTGIMVGERNPMLTNYISAQESSIRNAEHCSAAAIAIVDLMLDWDLPILELTLDELAEWLGVVPDDAGRALAELGVLPGTDVSAPTDSGALARVALDIDVCPLTAPRPGALRLVVDQERSARHRAFVGSRAV